MFHTQGVVLKKNIQREFDEVITVYTKDFGKIDILGRGVKKPTAKLHNHLQIFDLSNIEFVLGKKLRVLTGADLTRNIFASDGDGQLMRKNIRGFFDFLDDLIGFDEPDADIWNLIMEIFDFENNHKNENISEVGHFLLSEFFKFRLLEIAGFSPNLENCMNCGNGLKEGSHFFSVKEGGVVCEDCDAKTDPHSFPVLASTIKILRIFKNQNTDILKKIKLSDDETKDLSKVFDRFSGWILN